MLATYHVDHAITVPPPIRAATRYPFQDMDIGDSFAVDDNEYERASRAAYAYGQFHGMKFACRKIPGRIWRIK